MSSQVASNVVRGVSRGRGRGGQALPLPLVSRTASKRLGVLRGARKKTKAVEPVVEENVEETQKQKENEERLRDVQFRINKDFGEGTVFHFDQEPTPMERYSSGDPFLDYAIGGGYPKGRIVEIFGHSSSGKSTLALIAIAQVQREGGLCAYVDVENSFDGVYAQRMGVNLKQLLLVAHPGCGEQALQIVDQLARSDFDLIVLDSVSALVPKAEQEGQIMDDTIGSLARVMGKGIKYLTSDVKNANSVVIFINQLRNRIGGYGGPEVTSGGEALKYHASVRIQVKAHKADQIKDGDKIIGQLVQVKVEKNKTCIHGRKAQLYLYHGVGLDTIPSLVDACQYVGIITVKGAQYFFNESKLGMGKEKAVETVRQSPEIELQLRQALKDISLKHGIILEKGSNEDLDDELNEVQMLEEITSETPLEVAPGLELQ